MTPYVLIFLIVVACFVAGFLVGKKHGQRLAAAAFTLKDTVGRL